MADVQTTDINIKPVAPSIDSNDQIFISDGGTALKKISYTNLAKAIIEQYNASQLAGATKTIQTAFNELNIKLNPIANKNGNWLVDVDANTYTTTGIYPVRSGTNLPGTWLVLVVIATRDDTVIQYAYDSTYKYYRQFRGSWSTWEWQPSRAEVDALNSKLFKQIGANLSDEAFNALTADGLYVGYIPTTSCPCKQQWAYINVKSLSANANDVMQEVIGITSAITCTRMKNNGTWGSWVLAPTRAEMNAATVKTITVTATADANGYIDTELKYNQAVPLCVYSVTINGSAAYPFLYEFLMRGGSPAEKISVRIKKWNGDVYTGEITFSMKYI